jgi:formylglycine-generating enzyme required for sulfatase activity
MQRITLAAVATFFLVANAHAQSNCAGDISGDGQVNGVDLSIVLTSWGVCQANPAISGVYPPVGPAAGGTPIAIVGVDLGRTASVTIDGVIAPQFSVVSGTTVTAVTPAGSAGARAIVLRDAQGQQIAAASYSYFVSDLSWGTVIEQTPNPSVVTNASLRASIMATGLPWRVRDNGTGIEMLLVPPGTFDMGCTQPAINYGCQGVDLPVHTVTLTSGFYIGRYEVTQAQWQARIGSNPSRFREGNGFPNSAQRPVEQVSWNTVQGFLGGTGLRLPTEAEWEYACRAGTTTPFHSGPGFPNGTTDGSLVGQIAWYYYNTCSGGPGCQTMPVGGKVANALGLHDMLGNVWEWCGDWWSDYTSAPQTNPTGPRVGSNRVLRGGCWNVTDPVSSSIRIYVTPTDPSDLIGFRVARNP